MREFVYFSRDAHTSGNFKDLMKAGRLDIAIHVIIGSFFLSNKTREDVKLHLVFYGKPDPPKHIEISSSEEMFKFLSKKDVAGLIKRILFKYKKNKRVEAFPSCFVEKKSLIELVNSFKEEEKQIFLLDKKGSLVRDVKIPKNSVFIIGDHKGFPQKEKKRISKLSKKISVGPETYFASQTMTILQNELDLIK